MHLTPRLGTNVALLNGIIHIILERGWFDRDYVEAHAVGFDGLERTVQSWTPQRAAQVCEVPLNDLQRAAEIIGTSPRLVSTALQGVYQSHQATAAACQVNNIHIIRGMIGKPGCGIFQMNGQPSAQNTRETGADGEYPAFRNPQNAEDMEDLARIWNVESKNIPHWAHPTHIMQIMKFCEEGSIKLLWIVATNPAVTLPDLNRIRKILQKRDLFVVVQDAFMTETAQFADVVLPAAIWGEKTGTYTNADRTVHISHKAIDPPGQARSDLDIFLDYARRMDFRDKDGAPLLKWDDAEGAFEAWKACTAGRFCDYTGLSYAKLSEGSGIQWPCNGDAPGGTERLYTDGIFNTAFSRAEDYGHDLTTGALVTPQKYKAFDPGGKAIIKPSDYEPPIEQPDSDYPFYLTTGRIVYHFHTRTKTARASELNAAAPDAFVEISQEDADRYGAREGALLEIRSRRGRARARCRIAIIKPGTLFMPFHYGYFDDDEHSPRAANELTIAEWDPVSKQPYFKYAAVQISSVEK